MARRVAHHFALVCQRLDFVPSEAAAARVLGYVSNEISRKQRQAELLERKLMQIDRLITPRRRPGELRFGSDRKFRRDF